MRRSVASLLALLLIGSLAAPVGGHAPPDESDYEPLEDIKLTYELRPTAEPGTVRVTMTARLPSQLDSFEFGPPPGADVQVLDGFAPGGDELEYRWNGQATHPSMTYVRVVNETGEVSQVAAGPGWAILRRGDVGGRAFWRYYGEPPDFFQEVVPPDDTPSYVGDTIVLTGPHETVSATRSGEQFTLVVPAHATLAAEPDAVFDSLGFARRELDMGHTHDATVGIVQPAELREGGFVAGVGWPEFAVHEGQLPAGASNTWIHEYVHTRQNFSTTSRFEWIYEASAEYEAALLTLQHGNATWGEFTRVATVQDYADADLRARVHGAFPYADYEKGAAVVAVLDARIRNATDGKRSFETVLRRLNDRPGNLTSADFKAAVADVAGESMDAEIDRLVTETIDPAIPDEPFLYTTGPDADNDRDGLTTREEREAGTHPFKPDTDGDGRPDGAEAAAGTDPTVPNTATATPPGSDDGEEPRTDGPGATSGGDGALPLGALLATALLLGVGWRLRRYSS